MTEITNFIPARLKNAAVGGHVAGADDIIDENTGETLDLLSVKPATTGTTGDYPYNGLGRVILRKNMVSGVNTLTQDMFYKGEVGSRVPNTNTVFVVKYDFVLGEDITIPANCVLEFDGGSISGNGTNKDTITGNNTQIIAPKTSIFTGIVIAGTWNVPEITSAWFGDAQTVDNTLQQIENLLSDSIYNEVTIEAGDYWFVQTEDRANAFKIGKPYTKIILVGNLRLRGTDYNDKRFVTISSTHDVILTGGGYIFGDKLTHIYADGNTYPDGIIGYYQPDSGMSTYEKCHTLQVSLSYNVTIDGINIRNSVGDGIDLIHNTPTNSHSIIVRNVTIENTRRQGITANTVGGILENIYIKTVHGTSPEAGIDIEITTNADHTTNGMVLRNIRIEDCTTGIMSYAELNVAEIKEIIIENCDVRDVVRGFRIFRTINNVTIKNSTFESDLSRYGAKVGGARGNYSTIKNFISGNNCSLENCKITFINDIPVGEELTGKDVFALSAVDDGYAPEANNRRCINHCQIICPKINGLRYENGLSIENSYIEALYLWSDINPENSKGYIGYCTLNIANDIKFYQTRVLNNRIDLGGYIFAYTTQFIGNNIFHTKKKIWETDPNWDISSYLFKLEHSSFISNNKITLNSQIDALVVVGQTSTETSNIPTFENNFLNYNRFTQFVFAIPDANNSRIYAYNNNTYDSRLQDIINIDLGAAGNVLPSNPYKGHIFLNTSYNKLLCSTFTHGSTVIESTVNSSSSKFIGNTLTEHLTYFASINTRCQVYFSKTNSDPSESDLLQILAYSTSGSAEANFVAPNPIEYPYIYIVNSNTTSRALRVYDLNIWTEADGATAGVARNGATADRPVGRNIYVGFMYFDTSIGKPIYASAINGDTVTWVDATGATV